MGRFYLHFAAAYGTIWLAMLLAAVFSQSHINAGEFGLYGFPIIALVYGLMVVSINPDPNIENTELRRQNAELKFRLQNMDDLRDY